MTIKDKLSSRKFWLSAAAFLGSAGTTIAGVTVDNEAVTIIGVVCAALSAAIYAVCEAMIDKAAVGVTKELELLKTIDNETEEI